MRAASRRAASTAASAAAALLARRLARLVGHGQRGPSLLHRGLRTLELTPRGGQSLLQFGDLPVHLRRALQLQHRQLGLELADPRPVRGLAGRLLGGERVGARPQPLHSLAELGRGRGARLAAEGHALVRRAGGEHAPGQPLSLLAAVRQRFLGGLALLGHLRELGLDLVARGARGRGRVLRLCERGPLLSQAVARQLPARLAGLALETLVQLGRLGLALERAQARARLALDVERAVEVVLRALELELGAAPALAMLAQPGRLLHEQAPVAGLARHHRLHAPL